MQDPYLVKPDKDFLQRLLDEGGGDLKNCFQCATCSVVCELSTGPKPFPRKEMIWAQWGLRDRLLADPDVWLCYQCNDCSKHCPRGARPGDVMAAVRRESILHYAFPRFLAKWVNQPKYLPLLLLIPVVLLGLAMLAKDPMEAALGIARQTSGKIAYSYSNMLPHWLLISFFTFFSVLVLLAVIVGVVRFWRAMKAADSREDPSVAPVKGLGASILSVLKTVIAHDRFDSCITQRPRLLSHLCVFWGFIALFAVAICVVTLVLTAGFNPLLSDGVFYPFNFWSPWRMLANLGGVAFVAGCLLMVRDRLQNNEQAGTYSDWALIGTLLAVVLTGFLSEVVHYARLEPHRHAIYFVHLVCVFALLMYLPYSKFAHLIYRTTALVYAEHTGRTGVAPSGAADGEREDGKAEHETVE